jgi:Ca2+/H+ antiporter
MNIVDTIVVTWSKLTLIVSVSMLLWQYKHGRAASNMQQGGTKSSTSFFQVVFQYRPFWVPKMVNITFPAEELIKRIYCSYSVQTLYVASLVLTMDNCDHSSQFSNWDEWLQICILSSGRLQIGIPQWKALGFIVYGVMLPCIQCYC